MSRAGFFRASLFAAIVATLWTLSPSSTEARPRFGPRAVFGMLGMPLGVFGRVARPRGYAYRHRAARHRAAARHGIGRAAYARRGAAAMALASSPAWIGPAFWPNGYGDLAAYVAGASETDLRFWNGGFADVLVALVTPPMGDGRTAARSRSGDYTTASADAAATTGAGAPMKASNCPTPSADDMADLADRIEDKLKPSETQKAAFGALRAAVIQAGEDLRRTCPATPPASAPARLTAIQERLWAIQSAALALRKPLTDLYAGLDAAQKARLDGKGIEMPARRARSRTAAVPVTAAQICYMRAQESERTAERISRSVGPNADQQAPLKMLTEVSAGMAKLMIASCPTEPPNSATARLDAALARLDAMLYAVVVVATPLQGFYSSLSDEQKARFDALGGRPES